MIGPTPSVAFPFPLPDWVTSNHRRRAEVRVYDALRTQLPYPWRVFYSRPWLGVLPNGTEKDGEADFVLLHPDLGMLVLEIKGGQISRDALTEKWYSTDTDGDRFQIKNPVQQAMTSKHRLLELFKKLPGWKGRFITARHAVVFPDCVCPGGDLGPDMPAWLFAGIDEMPTLGQWVEERLEQHLPDDLDTPDELDDDGVELITRYFAKSFTLERPVGAALISDDESIRVLTDQQSAILNALETITRIGIPGPAGTGKTALAVEKARRLAKDGRKTLLLCFNRPLARQLQRDVGQLPLLEVWSFHALCLALSEKAGIKPIASASQGSDYFDRQLPNALEAAIRALPKERFEAVVIDEGQDFLESWWGTIEALLTHPATDPLFVFYDDNQKVYSKAFSLPASVPSIGLRLSRILRNSKSIVETVGRLIPKPYSADGPTGAPVAWLETESEPGVAEIGSELAQLVDSQHVLLHQIAVLVPDQAYRDRIVHNGFIGKYKAVDAEAAPGNFLVCDTVRRFKGLERPVVILVEPERFIGEPATLYVALTRARLMMILLAAKDRLSQLRALLT